MTTLTELAELHVAATAAEIADGKEAMAKLIFVGSDGELTVVAYPEFGHPSVKHVAVEDMRKTLADEGATEYVFAMEAWLSQRPQADREVDTTAKDFLMPRNDPQRTEALIVCGAARDGEGLMWHFPISRHGNRRILGEKIDVTVGGQMLMAIPLNELFNAPQRRKTN